VTSLSRKPKTTTNRASTTVRYAFLNVDCSPDDRGTYSLRDLVGQRAPPVAPGTPRRQVQVGKDPRRAARPDGEELLLGQGHDVQHLER
jgi:hypothetical protein